MNTEPNIVAVVFGDFDNNKLRFYNVPYFYATNSEASPGDYFLTHNGNNFRLVKIMRVITPEERYYIKAATFVKKFLLGKIDYEESDPAALEAFRAVADEIAILTRVEEMLKK